MSKQKKKKDRNTGRSQLSSKDDKIIEVRQDAGKFSGISSMMRDNRVRQVEIVRSTREALKPPQLSKGQEAMLRMYRGKGNKTLDQSKSLASLTLTSQLPPPTLMNSNSQKKLMNGQIFR